MTELSTSEAMKLIPSGPEQQAARESFLEKYSTAVPGRSLKNKNGTGKIRLVRSIHFPFEISLCPPFVHDVLAPFCSSQLSSPLNPDLFQSLKVPVWWDEEASKRTGHGICEYGGAFAKNAKKFLDAGHGRSTGFHAHLTNLDCLAHTVHMVLGDVIKRDSVAGLAQRPVIVVGQSMGGFATVLYVCITHPQSNHVPLLLVFHNRNYLRQNTPDSWFEAQFKLDPQSYTGDLRISTGLNILSALDFTNEHLADLIVPFQIMHGGSDRVTNPRGSIALYEQSKSTQKSIKIYPFVEHIMMRIGRDEEDDLPRQKILNDIIQWIDEIRAATPNP
ncbi:hypothetical protein H4Q26_006259 [Puccinia striiformis f. sp. tritici PST-130]|nr:hypothetical protein H4Q26_006259 [Puccinia striiformis f. sp. tritici PST-130]